ncbi:hypothetical protein SKAU_G00007860 [Synaphobranchus kaupii]|uniref:Uncharacterized protein n=1 Tax=Synaphobranchus kaupii TaxID=118154 RepID=A0A9Q1JBV7_SYNKA|nr:hypothetical protein SKAU_G00007860 [Synaphobranchus kaupii]
MSKPNSLAHSEGQPQLEPHYRQAAELTQRLPSSTASPPRSHLLFRPQLHPTIPPHAPHCRLLAGEETSSIPHGRCGTLVSRALHNQITVPLFHSTCISAGRLDSCKVRKNSCVFPPHYA